MSPTAKLFRFVHACDPKLCAGESARVGVRRRDSSRGWAFFAEVVLRGGCSVPFPVVGSVVVPRVLFRSSGAFSRLLLVFFSGVFLGRSGVSRLHFLR